MADYIRMIALSPTMEEGRIQKWKINVGDKITTGLVICEVETDKASMEYEAMDEGVLLHIIIQEGGSARVGDPIAIFGKKDENIQELLNNAPLKTGTEDELKIKTSREKKIEPSSYTLNSIKEEVDMESRERIKISPLAKKLALQKGLDIKKLKGSGPGGRIIKRDLDDALAGKSLGRVNIVPSQKKGIKVILEDKVIPLSQKRSIIAHKLSVSKFTAPHYYLKVKTVCDALLEGRKKINEKNLNDKLTLNAFFIKLAAQAVSRHPLVNSTWQDDKIIEHGSVDIGLAVALDDGLVTPVVRNCVQKGLSEINDELRELIIRAQQNKLTLDEMTGATFTISNLGSFGIDEFTAIINPPGSAILALGRIINEPVADDNNNLMVKKRMTMTLSCDHRVIDGAVGAGFLTDLKEMIENPFYALF